MALPATQSHIANVKILSRELAREAWYNTFWSKLAGFMTVTETNGIKQHNPVPGKVVQVMKDFIQEGRDNMMMPMILSLTEPGVYGDANLKGTGEVLQMKFLQLYINQWRKAVNSKPGAMANQRVKIYNLMEKAKPALVQWWAKAENQAVFEAMYTGISPNLAAGTNDEGLGLKGRLHPNWYYQDHTTDGKIVTVGTEKYSKTQSQITSDLTSAKLGGISAKALLGLVELITSELLIEPIVYDNSDPFWFMLVHPAQFKKLKMDSTIKGDQNAAYNAKLMSHPAINGKQMLYYEGFCIVPDPIGIRAIPTASTDIATDLAGARGWLYPSGANATNVIKNAIVLGANAIGKGMASSLQFTEEIDDHGNVKEIGSNQIMGYNRAEFFSEADNASVYSVNNATKSLLTSAYEATNQSSMIFSTED